MSPLLAALACVSSSSSTASPPGAATAAGAPAATTAAGAPAAATGAPSTADGPVSVVPVDVSAPAGTPPAPAPRTSTFPVPGFGAVHVRLPAATTPVDAVVLVLAASVDDVPADALAVDVPASAWRSIAPHPEKCWYPAGELETLAQRVEKAAGLPEYHRPILYGDGWGAAVAYAAVVQAPATTFDRAVAVHFDPHVHTTRRFCTGNGWHGGSPLPPPVALAPTASGAPRLLLDHPRDAAFVTSLGAAAGLGTVRDAVEPPAKPPPPKAPAPDAIQARLDALGLPLTVTWPLDTHRVFVFVSGDGGWQELDQGVSDTLAAHGIAVVGLSSLRYFWSEVPVDTFAADLRRILAALPTSMPVGAGGYSFGAEVIPVVLQAHPELPFDRVAVVAPTRFAQFEVSPLDWVRSGSETTSWSMARAFAALGRPGLCIESDGDDESGCPSGGSTTTRTFPGGHHFDGDYAGLGAAFATFLDG